MVATNRTIKDLHTKNTQQDCSCCQPSVGHPYLLLNVWNLQTYSVPPKIKTQINIISSSACFQTGTTADNINLVYIIWLQRGYCKMFHVSEHEELFFFKKVSCRASPTFYLCFFKKNKLLYVVQFDIPCRDFQSLFWKMTLIYYKLNFYFW